MTCIVAVKGKDGKIVLAGDRGASGPNTVVHLANPKIFNANGFLIGYAGSLAGDRLRYIFNPSTPEDDVNLDEHMATMFTDELKEIYDDAGINHSTPDSDVALLIVYRGNIYKHYASDMSICRIDEAYDALGTGEEYALGSLFSTFQVVSSQTRAELAVNASIKYSPSCSGKVDVLIAE